MRNGAARVAVDTPPERIPRISRLMALAIHFHELIRKGVVQDYADLARLGGVTRARVTQIMNLLNLFAGNSGEVALPTGNGKWTRLDQRARDAAGL